MNFSDWIILICCFAVIGIVSHFDKKWKSEIPNTYDHNTSVLVAEYMTTILTPLSGQVWIYKPIDALSTWHEPLQVGSGWIYRTKAAMLPEPFLHKTELKEFEAKINRRAQDCGYPIRVTDIYPQGQWYIYNIKIIS